MALDGAAVLPTPRLRAILPGSASGPPPSARDPPMAVFAVVVVQGVAAEPHGSAEHGERRGSPAGCRHTPPRAD